MARKPAILSVKDIATKEPKTSGRSSRRSPGLQARSRDRIDLILQTAEQLISAQGYEGLKMRELTRMTELPIASIYHYFPSTTAILRALTERHLLEIREIIAGELETRIGGTRPSSGVPAEVRLIVVAVATHLRANPATPAIWDALRAVPELCSLDIEDTGETARLLMPYIERAAPDASPETIENFSIFFVDAIQSNLSIIMHSTPERQDALTEALGYFAETIIRGIQRS